MQRHAFAVDRGSIFVKLTETGRHSFATPNFHIFVRNQRIKDYGTLAEARIPEYDVLTLGHLQPQIHRPGSSGTFR
jgi:hypothetical protein